MWRLRPIFDSYGAVGALTLVLLALLLSPPVFTKLSRGRRLVLMTLRLGVVLLLALLMLRPTCVITTKKPQTRDVLIYFDRSRSMTLPDGEGPRRRWDSQLALLETLRPLLDEAARTPTLRIRLFAFDEQAATLEPGGWGAMRPEGGQTDIGGSLSQGLRTALGERLVAAFLLSDGVQNAADATVDIHQAARDLSRQEVPLYTVAFGPAGDASQARDIEVESLPEQYSAFLQNDLLIRGVVRSRGYVNSPVAVELWAEGPEGGPPRQVGASQLVFREDDQRLPIEMMFVPEREGAYKLTLRAPQLDGEMVAANNELSTYVQVRQGLRVAHLFGTRLGEQQALRWSLGKAQGLQLDDRLIDIRTRESWPQDHADLLASDQYDAYLIESVNAAAFRREDLEALAERVSAGKGLMMIGGLHSFGPGGYQGSPLEPALPIVMGRFEKQSLDPLSDPPRDLHVSPADGLLMLPARDHPILRLAAPERNREAWAALPRLAGANKLVPAERTQLLAVGDGDVPLLVAGQFGKGRVLAFAGDSTSRWWRHGHREEHQRFWRQVVMWLAGRDEQRDQEVWVELPQRRFDPATRVPFTIGVRDESGKAVFDAQLSVELIAPDGARRPLPTSLDDSTWRGQTDRIDTPGDYRLEIVANRAGTALGRAEASFQVLDRDVELSVAAADHEQLARLAQLTQSAGGKLLAPEELRPLLERIVREPPQVEVDMQTSWELASTAGDGGLVFLALLTLLGSEWFLRKRWGMV